MSAKVFDEILLQGIRKGMIPAKTKAAREWFRDKAKDANANPSGIIRAQGMSTVKKFTPGEMILFNYDPKLKKDLPYYDTFPLIFPIGPAPKGFMGINMHYLPHRARAQLMDALYGLKTDKKYDDNTRLQISYDVLKAASRYKYFRPCIKHYLSSHIKSRKIKINSSEWDIALFLPIERFKKASKEKVWKESMEIARK